MHYAWVWFISYSCNIIIQCEMYSENLLAFCKTINLQSIASISWHLTNLLIFVQINHIRSDSAPLVSLFHHNHFLFIIVNIIITRLQRESHNTLFIMMLNFIPIITIFVIIVLITIIIIIIISFPSS